MMDENQKRDIRRLVQDEMRKLLDQPDAVKKSIKQRHLEANVIFFGLDANKPSGGSEVKCWFSTDTDTLYLWNGSAWVGETLT